MPVRLPWPGPWGGGRGSRVQGGGGCGSPGSRTGAHLLRQGQGRGVGDGGPGIRHGTHHGDTPGQGSSCARGKVLLVCPPWFPQVHMDVDQSWENTQAASWRESQRLKGIKVGKQAATDTSERWRSSQSGASWMENKELRVRKILGPSHSEQSRVEWAPWLSFTAAPTGVQEPGSLLRCTYQVAAQASGRSCSQRAPSKEGLVQSVPVPTGEKSGSAKIEGQPGSCRWGLGFPINQASASLHLSSLFAATKLDD